MNKVKRYPLTVTPSWEKNTCLYFELLTSALTSRLGFQVLVLKIFDEQIHLHLHLHLTIQ